jgi:transcriptional regulator with XRE-family HTH domain
MEYFMSDALPPRRGRTASGRPNPVDLHVGNRLRLRRVMLGLSQDRLAASLGLTFQQIQKYERGVNRIPASRLFDLAQVMGVGIDYFYEGMREAVMRASPRHIPTLEAEPVAEGPPAGRGREMLELVRAYYRIDDPMVRKRVRDLASALAAVFPPEDK